MLAMLQEIAPGKLAIAQSKLASAPAASSFESANRYAALLEEDWPAGSAGPSPGQFVSSGASPSPGQFVSSGAGPTPGFPRHP